VTFSISSKGAVTEGANSVFTITKSGTAVTSLSVNYATANGTAVASSDYTATSGTLTFTTAQASQTVCVATVNDSTVETAETFTMSLSAPTGGATIGTGTATATINDNDTNPCAGVSFAVNNVSVTEGGNLGFTVTKSGSTASSCSVSYATANGTAAAGSDYTAKSGTLTFSSTQTSLAVSVATINDTTIESAETVLLNLSNATGGATIADSQGVGTINDNDTLPCTGVSFNVAGTAANEGSPLVFTVGKTGSTSSSCSVNYATSDDTAVAGTDYIAKSGTLTFSSTQTSQTVSVSTIDNDRLVDRYMYLNLSSPTSGATLSNSQASGDIIHSGGTGGCTFRCQTPLQSPEATDSTVTTQPAPDSTQPPGEIGLIDIPGAGYRGLRAERLAAVTDTFGWSARS
jgi:chorismate-pyruvate lyase